MDKMAIYNRLPIWGQNLACFYEGSRIKRTRYGKDFRRFLSEYESRANWSYEQLCEYRDARLRKMIHHCYNTVPYYTRLFNEGGINPDRIKTLDDLKVLPILTKDEVKENIDSLISTAIPKNSLKIHATGGTTGTGLNFYTTDTEEAEQWAVWWRYRRAHGISLDTWCGNFGGKVVVPLSSNKPPFFRENIPGKQLYFSGYHISEKSWIDYHHALIEKSIKWIHGYPSNIANLASYFVEHGVCYNLDFVSIGAENLYSYQKDVIKRAFGKCPIQHYGLTEGVANISQWPDMMFRVDEDFCGVEFIPYDGDICKVIGTSLSCRAMPLIRYDTGDLVFGGANADGYGGRIVNKFDGRQSELLLMPSGKRISGAIFNLIFKDFPTIKEAQITQKSVNRILICVVKSASFSMGDEMRLRKAAADRIDDGVKIEIAYVAEIPRTKSGKLKLVVSEIEQ